MSPNLEISVAGAIGAFLSERGANLAFAVAGGASLHLIHGFSSHPGCSVIPLNHEQSVGMAADAYSRAGPGVGVGIVTSGPGVTNLVTSIAGCFYDSVPVVFLVGQVSTSRMAGDSGVRQFGFQETPIFELLAPICKVVTQIYTSENLRNSLEETFEEAVSGRPGPVVFEVPDDIQREMISWPSPATPGGKVRTLARTALEPLDNVLGLINSSQRPVVIAGAGVVRSEGQSEFKSFIEKSGIPTVLTWGAAGVLPTNHPRFAGYFGTHGDRYGNFVVQNSDLVLSVGSRLDTKATGTPMNSFARQAKKVVVDIDPNELSKFEAFGVDIEICIASDAREFLIGLEGKRFKDVSQDWLSYCDRVREQCRKFDSDAREGPGINPYSFIEALSRTGPDSLNVIVDTGCVLPYVMTSLALEGERALFHDFNNTAMGWSIPATIGVGLARPEIQTLTIIGDGSLMMGINDLVSLAKLVPNAKIVLVDNSGYSMIKQTQDQWLDSQYLTSSIEGGLHFPDFDLMARASGYEYFEAVDSKAVPQTLDGFWQSDGPSFLRVAIDSSWRVIPLVRAGKPNEDMDPKLDDSTFGSMMLIPKFS
jgi:acetolactate synthase-1/2/3 large subunit